VASAVRRTRAVLEVPGKVADDQAGLLRRQVVPVVVAPGRPEVSTLRLSQLTSWTSYQVLPGPVPSADPCRLGGPRTGGR
jgi:hypothetical protein